MAPYQYQPLDPEANHIRLTMLLLGDFSAEVRVELIHKPLLSDRRPKFEALSYTWGLVDNPSHIYVGSIGDNTLIVTQNLRLCHIYDTRIDCDFSGSMLSALKNKTW